jgi:hypothetical protein
MPVVVMSPLVKHGSSLIRMLVDEAIGPFPKCELDKALGLAVSLWTIRFRDEMFQFKRPATRLKGLCAKR